MEMSYSKMPLKFPWLKFKGMKMASKKRQQTSKTEVLQMPSAIEVNQGQGLNYVEKCNFLSTGNFLNF